MRLWRACAALGLCATLGCAQHTPASNVPVANPSSASRPPPPPLPTVAASPSASAPTPALAGASAATPCGALDCSSFASPEAAFDHVLEAHPRVLAVGETHARKGTENIPSNTRRFAELFLPRLAGKAKDIVIELLVQNGSCGKVEANVKERQAPVTEQQAATNQNEFLSLGRRAKAYGITPHALTPSCEDYRAVAAAGSGDIARMLQMVADESARQITRLLAALPANADTMVLAYGGALHNDLLVREGHEAWTFGPRLAALTEQRYVELDLIVPEYVEDTPAWRALPWFSAFDRGKNAERTTLYRPGPNSYVLIFPVAAGVSGAPSPP